MNRTVSIVLCAAVASACVLFPAMLGLGFSLGWLGARYATLGLP